MPHVKTLDSAEQLAALTDAQTPKAPTETVAARLTLLLALSVGLTAATLYYAQPILGVLAAELGASERTIGLVPTATLLGYALGILFLAPLGDRYDRRRIILFKAVGSVVALLGAAVAPDVHTLIGASLAIGITASMTQDIVPAAATVAPEHDRGRIVGIVMTGLLLGILMSRVLSGIVAEHFGWRAVFFAAAGTIAVAALALAQGLPRFAPTTSMPYGTLLKSLVELWRRHPALRRAALAQGLLASAFAAFWSTLAVMLHGEPFHYGSAAAGAFGLAGAAGAAIAPISGRFADRRGPQFVTRVGTLVTVLSFVVMGLATFLSPQTHLGLLILATVGFDLGVQGTLIAHQTIVYSLEPAARSRINAVFVVTMFAAMSVGAAVGAMLLAAWGWLAVVAYAAVVSLAAFGLRLKAK
ncbi:MAG: MFS transporter [Polyangiaceae bacterium]|nr:MFS transporter [Polyangiaceae bacterium]MCB9605579.1 MFS transporter [Polyangiaceae bacterium]